VLGRGRPSEFLAIDWDARTLRVIQAVVSKRGVRIEKILSAPVPLDVEAGDSAQMGAHIRSVLDQERIRTKHAAVDITRDQVVLNTLRLPCSAPDELPGMVQIQVAKQLPFPVADAAIDFAVPSGARETATADVLVAAVRKELLDQYSATASAAGLRLDRIGLRPHACKVAVCDVLDKPVPERVMFIDVGSTLTEIDIFRDGHLAFARAASVMVPEQFDDDGAPSAVLSVVRALDDEEEEFVPPPSSLPANLEPIVSALIREVSRTLEAYRASDHGAMIDQVVVGGDRGIERPLAREIAARMRIPSRVYNPAGSFGWPEEEGRAASAYAAAAGLVLSHDSEDQSRFDFLHPKRVVSRTGQNLKKAPVLAAIAAMFLIACVLVVEGFTREDRQYRAKLQADIAELGADMSEKKKFIKFVEGIRSFDADRLIWLDVMHDLIAAMPDAKQIVLDEIRMYEDDRKVTVATKTKSREVANDLVEKINALGEAEGAPFRFRARIKGSRKPKDGEDYPFDQDVEIEVRRVVKSSARGRAGA
jgi:type IV pilus assembly protein PilM